MSLINQMLKDLEKRRASELDSETTPLRGVSHYAVARSSRHGLLYLALAVIVLLLAAVGWLGWERYQSGSAAQLGPAPVSASATVNTATTSHSGAGQKKATSSGSAPPAGTPDAPPAAPSRAGGTGTGTARARGASSPQGAAPVPSAEPAVETQADRGPSGPVIKRPRPQSKRQLAEAAYQRGYQQVAGGRLTVGEQSLREALQLAPEHEHARELLAGVLIQQGRYVEAGDILQEGLARNPGNARLAMLQARVLLAQERVEEAVRVLERQPPPLAVNPDYYALLAALYQRLGKHQAAVGVYRQLVALRPDAGNWQLGLGISLEALGDRSGARQAYEAALQSGSLPERLVRYGRSRLAALQEDDL